jgi:hypothetical protein
VRLVNLTPHPVTLIDGEGKALTIPPSGTVCRAEERVEILGHVEVEGLGTLPVRRVEYGVPVGLPDAEPGVGYIVSSLAARAVAIHCPERQDVYIVADPVRDEQGRIVGARALARV